MPTPWPSDDWQVRGGSPSRSGGRHADSVHADGPPRHVCPACQLTWKLTTRLAYFTVVINLTRLAPHGVTLPRFRRWASASVCTSGAAPRTAVGSEAGSEGRTCSHCSGACCPPVLHMHLFPTYSTCRGPFFVPFYCDHGV